jgi:hypothetical protein
MATGNSDMKKIRIKGYCFSTWTEGFKQIALLPCPYITYNPLGHFIETGVATSKWVISINFLGWDFGIQIYSDLEY